MEENKHCADGLTSRPKCACGLIPLALGVIFALAFGWWVFPDLMFSKQSQPVFFTHNSHVNVSGLSCDTCHNLTADGAAKLPTNEACSGCHNADADFQTPDPTDAATKRAREAEITLVQQYISKDIEVPWLAHQTQPDNVFFSHAAHFQRCFTCHVPSAKGKLQLGTAANPEALCTTCHIPLAELDKNPPVETNVLTGYRRTTIKMWQCEQCHAIPGHYYYDGKGRFNTSANNACYTCHK